MRSEDHHHNHHDHGVGRVHSHGHGHVPHAHTPGGDGEYEEVGDSGLVVPVVTRGGQEPDTTNQSEGATRISGVSPQHTPATKIWFGKVHNLAGYRSVPHHHGEAETGGFVLSGKARIYFGRRFEDYIDMSEGDWVFVPPHMPHVECNLDRNNPLTWMTTRTPDNIVVNLPQVEDSELPDWESRP